MPAAKQIALVASDPFVTEPDQLDEEAEIIKRSFRDREQDAEVITIHERSEKELFGKLGAILPQIVEFTAHGSPNQRILMRDARGNIRKKTASSIAGNLKHFDRVPECVFFNNCIIGNSTKKIRPFTEHCIQIKSAGPYDISLDVAEKFYDSMALENNYQYAFDQTLHKMREEGISFTKQTGLWHREEIIEEEFVTPDGSSYKIETEMPPLAAAKMVDESEFPRKCIVWYATNRKPLNKNNSEFGGEYDDAIHYGKCEVAIPKYHKKGSVGTPFWKRWPVWKDDYLTIVSKTPFLEDHFWNELKKNLEEKTENDRCVLLFIHGYAVTFTQAVIRAGQIGADLNVTGATAVFSWPSKGRMLSYAADEASVEPSSKYLSKFLRDLVDRSGAQQIHVVAHSMGNRAFLRAINELITEVKKDTQLPFSQFFLAAPDIDVRTFKQFSLAYSQCSKRTTMYVSAKDKALLGSTILHEYPRAGYQPPITIVDKVDTIEVANIDVDILGHSYIAQATDLLHDMYSLILADPHPSKRMGLIRSTDPLSGLEFWKMQK